MAHSRPHDALACSVVPPPRSSSLRTVSVPPSASVCPSVSVSHRTRPPRLTYPSPRPFPSMVAWPSPDSSLLLPPSSTSLRRGVLCSPSSPRMHRCHVATMLLCDSLPVRMLSSSLTFCMCVAVLPSGVRGACGSCAARPECSDALPYRLASPPRAALVSIACCSPAQPLPCPPLRSYPLGSRKAVRTCLSQMRRKIAA